MGNNQVLAQQKEQRVSPLSLSVVFEDLDVEKLSAGIDQFEEKRHKKTKQKSWMSLTPQPSSQNLKAQLDQTDDLFLQRLSIFTTKRQKVSSAPNSPKKLKRLRSCSQLKLSEPRPEDDEKLEKTVFMDCLTRWTHLSSPEVVFNSKTDSLDYRSFNSKVMYKENLLFVFVNTLGEVFGCFNTDPLYMSEEYHQDDSKKKFFLFYLNPESKGTIQKKAQASPSTISLGNSHNAFLFTCFSAFWVSPDLTLTFHQSLKLVYDLPKYSQNPFSIKSINETQKIKTFFVLQFK